MIESDSEGNMSDEYVALIGNEADLSDSSSMSAARTVSKSPNPRMYYEADLSDSSSLSSSDMVATILNTQTHHEADRSDSSNISAMSIVSKIPNTRSRPIIELAITP